MHNIPASSLFSSSLLQWRSRSPAPFLILHAVLVFGLLLFLFFREEESTIYVEYEEIIRARGVKSASGKAKVVESGPKGGLLEAGIPASTSALSLPSSTTTSANPPRKEDKQAEGDRGDVTSAIEASSGELVLTVANDGPKYGARCLDGSPPGFYYRSGRDSGAKNWLLHFRAGAWCATAEDCLERSATSWGSSERFFPTLKARGCLSSDPSINPDMHNWNLVVVPYCDGSSFTGNRNDPIEIEGRKLYFRGQKILEFIIRHIGETYGMNSASQVVVSGCSAGGLAVYLHCDFIRKTLLPQNIDVKCLADAGFFLEMQDISGKYGMRKMFKDVETLHNSTSSLPQGCVRSWPERQTFECFFPKNVLQHISTPMFILNSNYDSWSLANILVPESADPSGKVLRSCATNLGTCNATQLAVIHGFREAMVKEWKSFATSHKESAVFSFSCENHCTSLYDAHWKKLTVQGKSPAMLFGEWLKAGKDKKTPESLFDCPYPCNSCRMD